MYQRLIFLKKKIRELFKKADICINLVGVLYEKKGALLKISIQFFRLY